MKKFLFLGALAAMLLGTASCSNDMEPAMTDDGMVQFKVELPGNVDSRAIISDGLTATELQVAVYKEKDDGTRTLLNDISLLKENNKQVTMVGKQATVNFKLVKGQKYSFVFWAQNPGCEAYAFDASTGKVTVDYSKALANVDDGDAFCNNLKNKKITGPLEQTITLTRPFAQLNYGDVMEDYEAAVAADIDINQTVVTVKQVATEFDIFAKKASGENLVDVTWPAAASVINEDLTVNEEDYTWLSMCYFLVPNDQATVETELSMLNTAGTEFNKLTVDNVPVQKNHRTNILGEFFTENAVFNIVIDERFDTPDYIVINGLAGLMITAANCKSSTMTKSNQTMILTEDASNLTRFAFGIIASGETTWELNGHSMTFKDAMFSVETRGSVKLNINGPGSIINTAASPTLWCAGTSVMNLNGDVLYDGVNSGGELIYCYSGTININGGTFKMTGDTHYMLNCYDSNYQNGTAKIIVTGGKFYNFDPSNNTAEGAGTNFVADGYTVISYADGEDTVYEVVPA